MATLRESPQSQAAAQQPPISELLPLIFRSISTVASFSATTSVVLFQISRSVLRGVFFPLRALLPIAVYILAPVLAFLSLTVDAFIVAPYNLFLHTLRAMHPVYVFCGVAFIVSVVLGFGGRALVMLMKAILLESRGASVVESPGLKRKKSANRRKRVKIEE